MSDLKDSILTSITAQRMVDHVSPIYDNSYVGLWVFEAIAREYEEAHDLVRTLPEQLFPETATWAIDLWERRYNIAPDPELTIEERRARVIQKRTVPRPMNPETMIRMIRNLTQRAAEYQEHVAPYTFGIYIEDKGEATPIDYGAVHAMIRKHKQAHKSYDFGIQTTTTINIETKIEPLPIIYPIAGAAITAATRQTLI